MTQGEIEVELKSLREQVLKLQQRQEGQQTKLARWAVAFLGASLVPLISFFVYANAGTGESTLFATFIFLSLSFGSLSQPGGSIWSRKK